MSFQGVLGLYYLWKTSSLCHVKNQLFTLWWQVSHFSNSATQKVWVCVWGVCVWVCVFLSDTLRGNWAKHRFGHCLGEQKTFCEDACLRHSSRGETGQPEAQVEWKFHSCPHGEAELPQFPEGTPRRIRLGQAEPKAIKDRARPAAGGFVFPKRSHCPPHLPLPSPLSPYLERNWGYWWGTGWDCKQEPLPGRLWGNLQRHKKGSIELGKKKNRFLRKQNPVHPLHGPFQTVYVTSFYTLKRKATNITIPTHADFPVH